MSRPVSRREAAIETLLLYVGIFAVLVGWVCYRPAAAVGALLVSYGLEQWAQSQSPFFFQHRSLTNIAIAGLVGLAVFFRLGKGLQQFGPITREQWAIFGLYALAVISVGWSVYPEGTISQFRAAVPYILVFAVAAPLLVRDLNDVKASLQVVLLVGGPLLVYMLFFTQWTGRSIQLEEGRVGAGAIVGDAGAPLAIASMAGYVALAALLMKFRGLGRGLQLARWGLFAVGTFATFNSGSRGQLFALVICAVIFIPMSFRVRNVGSFVGMMIALGFMALIVAYGAENYTATRNWSGEGFIESYTSGRVDTTIQLLGHWFDAGPLAWLLGLGSSASYSPLILGFYPHMVMGEVLGELGIVGFVILWLVPIFAFKSVATIYHWVREDPESRGLLAALAALFLFEVVLSFKQGSMLGNVNAFAFAAMLGRVRAVLVQQQAELALLEDVNHGGYYDQDGTYVLGDADDETESAPQGGRQYAGV